MQTLVSACDDARLVQEIEAVRAAHDVVREFAACSLLSPAILEAGHRAGIKWAKIARRVEISKDNGGRSFYGPRAAQVVFLEDGRFEFADAVADYGDTVGAMIFMALGEGGDELDLVAWAPPRPAAMWLGRVGLLGAEGLHRASPFDRVMVFFEILPWLRRSMHGMVIVDDRLAAEVLQWPANLVTQNYPEGKRLEAITTRRTPWVHVVGDRGPT